MIPAVSATSGAVLSIIVGTSSQSHIGYIVSYVIEWFRALVQNFELIALFSGFSLLAWLELKIRSLSAERVEPRKNLEIVSDYFLISFGLFAVAALIDFAMTNPLASLYGNAWLVGAEGFCFIFGLILLCTGVFGLRQTGRKGVRHLELNTYATTFWYAFMVSLSTFYVLARSVSNPTETASQSTLYLLLFLSYIGAFLATVSERRSRRWLVGFLMVIPIMIAVMLAAF